MCSLQVPFLRHTATFSCVPRLSLKSLKIRLSEYSNQVSATSLPIPRRSMFFWLSDLCLASWFRPPRPGPKPSPKVAPKLAPEQPDPRGDSRVRGAGWGATFGTLLAPRNDRHDTAQTSGSVTQTAIASTSAHKISPAGHAARSGWAQPLLPHRRRRSAGLMVGAAWSASGAPSLLMSLQPGLARTWD